MSTRRCSSSWMRYSKASLTFIFRFLVRWPKMLGNMSFMLTSISSTPWLVMISNAGIDFSRTSSSTMRSSSLPSRNCWRNFSRVREPGSPASNGSLPMLNPICCGSCAAGRVLHRSRHRRQQQIEQALFRVQFGLVGNVFQLLFAHHVDGDLHQVADHRLDIAAHIADLGELRRFHLHEGGVRQLRQAARDLGFAHAGGTDHDDVLRDHFFGELGRELLAAHAIAQRDGHGALRLVLADNIFVELAHDFARGQFVECDVFFICGCWKINSQFDVPLKFSSCDL